MREGSGDAAISPGGGAEHNRAAMRCYMERMVRERTRQGSSL
jgi:hypothetical protein